MNCKMFKKTNSDSALREGRQRSLSGAADDNVSNMGADVSLDGIFKKFAITYGSER